MIRVLVVDRSVIIRKSISDILKQDTQIEVIGHAGTGQDALRKAGELKPDVMTLGIDLPDIPGLDVLNELLRTNPIPVVVISTTTKPGSQEWLRAFDYGAVEVLNRPVGDRLSTLDPISTQLITSVKGAAHARVRKTTALLTKEPVVVPRRSNRIVVIGASTGGPVAIQEILTSLPKEFPAPIILVQHMPKKFTATFAERLNKICAIRVKEAKIGDELEPGLALLAPGGTHMCVIRSGSKMRIALMAGPNVNGVKPSVDVTMESVAGIAGSNTVGVLLTGMGADGVFGLKAIKDAGGETVVQDKSTSMIFGMPKEAIQLGVADTVLPIQKIADKIASLL